MFNTPTTHHHMDAPTFSGPDSESSHWYDEYTSHRPPSAETMPLQINAFQTGSIPSQMHIRRSPGVWRVSVRHPPRHLVCLIALHAHMPCMTRHEIMKCHDTIPKRQDPEKPTPRLAVRVKCLESACAPHRRTPPKAVGRVSTDGDMRREE